MAEPFTVNSSGSASLTHFLFSPGIPTPYPENANTQENDVLNDERGLAFQPTVRHPGKRGDNKGNKARHHHPRIPVDRDERRSNDCRRGGTALSSIIAYSL
jgi:hypothetical protein